MGSYFPMFPRFSAENEEIEDSSSPRWIGSELFKQIADCSSAESFPGCTRTALSLHLQAPHDLKGRWGAISGNCGALFQGKTPFRLPEGNYSFVILPITDVLKIAPF